MARRLDKTYPKGNRMSPLGINIGKAKTTSIENTIDDYLKSIDILHKSADYFTINISSPNTPGLRDLHKSKFLDPLLKGIDEKLDFRSTKDKVTKIPYLLKISPDESFASIENIVEIASRNNVKGIIATNTTITRPRGLKTTEKGGLSGKAIENKSIQIIKFINKLTNDKIPIIGVGGISDCNSAIENLMQVQASFNFIHLWFIMDLCCQNTFFMNLSKEKLGKVNELNPILYFFKRDQLKL